ncbi:MAG: glycosyltransferase family 2 protein [Candidatus Magasanikbacteria bacterium]
MDLSVITVNTNDREQILGQLATMENGCTGLNYEQIISDNGSVDGSVAEIKMLFPAVKMVENGKNIGFAAANNSAVQLAQGDFVLFLNPDMRLRPDSLKILIDWLRVRSQVGILSCKLTDEQNNFKASASPRHWPGIIDQIIILLKLPHFFPGLIKRYLFVDFDPQCEQKVDSVRGSFMLVRQELIQKLGFGFDPRYFIWFEDVDLCREAYRHGYEVWYTPTASCVDYVGQNFKRLPSGLKQRWFTASMVKYFKKWEPWYKWMWISLFRPVGVLLTDISEFFFK